MDERRDVWMGGRMYGWEKGCMDERRDVWMKEGMYGCEGDLFYTTIKVK